ncbi:MFS general substrate transporter [Gonapodya prolifera JEL478]|uniref:MFS general substrate transporter n=1 Tax=Gonapodya prolifera (strain JEL478) TaxID=1344416 RepID=A0A139AWN7_GONPJ|nr:MFS general substrate transporter [Gonapodya prolifera JEL478]|eukprot:KXS21161.1 MFS general substrate transporter [Gonapodya prolifera JEL478]
MAAEEPPVVFTESETTILNEQGMDARLGSSSDSGHSQRKRSPSRTTPLPTMQLFVVSIVALTEFVQQSILFPFVYFMVRDFKIAADERQLGTYVGILASTFSIAQFFSNLPWGWVSDKWGRRPVLLIGLLANSICALAFGMSKSYSWALGVRILQGAFNANTGVAKSVVAEITDKSNEAVAFSYFFLFWRMGSVLGPALGGFLTDPAKHFPSIFARYEIWRRFPYLLPCVATSFISFVGFLLGVFYLQESKGRRAIDPNLLSGGEHSSPPPYSEAVAEEGHAVHSSTAANGTTTHTEQEDIENETSPLLGRPSVPIKSKSFETDWWFLGLPGLCWTMLGGFFCAMFMLITDNELFPLYASTPAPFGGLNFQPRDIGVAITIFGAVNMVGQAFFYHSLELTFGRLGLFRWGMFGAMFQAFLMPFLGYIAGNQVDGGGYISYSRWILVWVGLVILLVGKSFFQLMAVTSSSLLIIDAAPAVKLGLANGASQSGVSLAGSFGPSLFGMLYSFSLQWGYPFPFDRHLVYNLLAIVGLAGFLISWKMRRGLLEYGKDGR